MHLYEAKGPVTVSFAVWRSAKAKRETSYGCISRGNQTVGVSYIVQERPAWKLFSRDQAEREARYSRHGVYSSRTIPLMNCLTNQSISAWPWTVCDCNGRWVFYHWRDILFDSGMVAYDGQSGSKDRGDPQVLGFSILMFPIRKPDFIPDFECFCCEPPTPCHRTNFGKFLCKGRPGRFCWYSLCCLSFIIS